MSLETATQTAWSLVKAQREQRGDGIHDMTRMMRAAKLWSETDSVHVRSLLEQAFMSDSDLARRGMLK